MKSSGVLAAVLAALCMGTMGVFSRKTGLPAEVITFFRLLLGGVLVALLLLVTGQLHHLRRRPGWPVLLNGGMLAGFIIFYVEAMNLTTMANAIMILYLAPLAASLVAHFFMGERLSKLTAGLIGIALLGFAMMMEFKLDFSGDGNHLAGVGFSLAGMACYAGFILINRLANPRMPATARTLYQLLVGACCMLVVMGGSFGPLTGDLWPWLLGVGLIPGFGGILFAVIALEKLPAATYGTLAYLEPIFVVLLGWTIFDERLNLLQLSGCALILASGIITSYLASKNREELPAPEVHLTPEARGQG